MTSYWRRLLDVALDQHGYVTSRDARELGIPVVTLPQMSARGQLLKAGHGIYLFEELQGDQLNSCMRATLWADGRGVLSHDTMLDLYGISDANPEKIHITVPKGYRARAKGGEMFVVHHADLGDDEVQWFEGIKAVTPYVAIRQGLESETPRYLLHQAIVRSRKVGLITQQQHDDLDQRLLGERS